MKMRSNLDWNAIVAVCLLAGTSVSARVCVLSTEPDGDRVKFVLPPGDPCSCTQVMLGGHNAYAPPRKDQPVYIDTLPMDAKGLRRSQGCPDESTQSVSREQTSTSQDETTESPVTSAAQGIMYKDCQDALDKGITTSGVYTIDPYKTEPFKAYCDMTENPEKGYIVIQRRSDGSVNFSRNWAEYEQGFGDPHGEFWLGNDKIHKITTFDGHDWELLVTLTAFNGLFAQARYDKFSIKAESDRYETDFNFDPVDLNDAGDAFNSKMFSTFDVDNDDDEKNCAKLQNGGWWFGNCDDSQSSNLNGKYTTATVKMNQGIYWSTWKAGTESLKETEMKIRRGP